MTASPAVADPAARGAVVEDEQAQRRAIAAALARNRLMTRSCPRVSYRRCIRRRNRGSHRPFRVNVLLSDFARRSRFDRKRRTVGITLVLMGEGRPGAATRRAPLVRAAQRTRFMIAFLSVVPSERSG